MCERALKYVMFYLNGSKCYNKPDINLSIFKFDDPNQMLFCVCAFFLGIESALLSNGLELINLQFLTKKELVFFFHRPFCSNDDLNLNDSHSTRAHSKRYGIFWSPNKGPYA